MTEKTNIASHEQYYMSSQWTLMRRKFARHRLAKLGLAVLFLLYSMTIFCGFFSTNNPAQRNVDYAYCPGQRVRFFDELGKFHFRPFVYDYNVARDQVTLEKKYTIDITRKYPVAFFVRSHSYKLFNMFETDIHFIGIQHGKLFLFGTDKLGRDLFSRILYGGRTSLTIGLVGVSLSFVLGCFFGGISGYYGGRVDIVIQRLIEFLLSLPAIPLWLALAAAIPADWPSLWTYLAITVILSLIGWCGLARTVRGKLISLRQEDYIMAAKLYGCSESRIISVHLLPAFLSYLIVNLTLAVPGMILGETALSFLGLGLKPPVVSWGVLLSDAQNVQTIEMHPWLLIPGLFVIVTVLAFNFLGDGLRDAADPYK